LNFLALLALRAKVRTSIRPSLSLDWRSATRAGNAGLAIGMQRLGKVARLPIYVLVLLIKARAALGNRLAQYLSRNLD
jgi:hypothetical protein